MSEYSSIIQGMFGAEPQTNVTANIGVDPEKTARAMELEKVTGVPASIIGGDLESFEKEHKANLASSIVSTNPKLVDYINSHPLAAQVSNDDYGTLDKISQSIPAFVRSTGRAAVPAVGSLPAMGAGATIGSTLGTAVLPGIGTAVGGIGGALAGGIGGAYAISALQNWLLGFLPEETTKGTLFDPEIARKDLLQHPTASFLGGSLPYILTMKPTGAGMLLRSASAAGNIGIEAGQELWQEGKVDPTNLALSAAIGFGFANPNIVGARAINVGEAAAKALPWTSVGITPPQGIHPLIDQAKAEFNSKAVDELDRLVSTVQESTTRERAPELFADFVRRNVGNSTIELSGERAIELYGDRLPAPDDGILGWVSNITEQLSVARDTGADISIPLADWISKVDPAIAKELSNDLRVARGGITRREAAESAAIPPIPIVDDPVAAVRHSAGLEPLFSVGDRRLALKKIARESDLAEDGSVTETPFHDFDIINEKGEPVGYVNISEQDGGKTLYIDNIGSLDQMAGDYFNPNNFGPALMRDLLRQVKQEFPNAEVLTGHRVTGARGKAESFQQPSAFPKIRLDNPADWETAGGLDQFSELLNGKWESIGNSSLEAYIKPTEAYKANEQALVAIVDSELSRIVPNKVTSQPVSFIRRPGSRGTVRGVYSQFAEQYPIIYWAMNSDDPVGVARHEAIHHLRAYGFFKPEEWATLEKAVQDEGWMKKFGIEERYTDADPQMKLEEAIADGFRQWSREYEIRKTESGFQQTAVDRIFLKLKEFLDNIRQRINEIFGGEVGWEKLFEKTFEGEIGAREGTTPRHPGAFRESRGEAPISTEGMEQIDPFKSARDVGMTVEQYKRYQKLIAERHQADIKASAERILREQTKRQTKEWKEQSEAMRPQVVADINARPEIAADKFFGLGELFGEKLDRTYRLDWEALTPEERAALPERYTVRKGGVSPDEVAPLFGYQTGKEMIAALAAVHEAREASGLGRERFMRKLIDAEINHRMEMEHGLLEKNIIEETKDQVLSENQLNILHEETTALAMMSGEQGFNLTRQQIETQLREKYDALPMRAVDSEKFLREAGKAGKAAEMELLRKNPAEAFKAKQIQYLNMIMADFARRTEKAQSALDRTAKPYVRNRVGKIEPVYVDHIQKLLQEAGYKIRRTPEELAHSLDFHGKANLTDFVNEVAGDGWDPSVADWIQSNGAKPIESMTVAEFADFKDAIDSLNHIGREVRSIIIAGERQDFADFKAKVIDNITKLPMRPRNKQGKWLFQVDASLTRMEEMMKDLDLRQELGPLWDSVIHPMVLSKSKEFDMMTELSKYFQETRGKFGREWKKSLNDSLPNDIIWDPYTESFYDMTRGNLIQIMLNWGNRSNIEKFVAGAWQARYKRNPTKEQLAGYEAQIKSYIDQHAKVEDWQFVQRMWEPFKGWAKEMDTVARNTTGVAPAWIPIEKVQTPHGEFEGGYWPVKYDQLASGIAVVKDRSESGTDGIFGTNYFRAGTSKGYLKRRTGYVDFVDISNSIEQSVATMQQTIHDISFRDALIQASKVFYDKEIRAAIRKHYGAEYEAQLIPWLKRISYQFSANEPALSAWNNFLRRARINLVGHSLPLNLKVILSPDVGTPNPMVWARFESNRKANSELAMKHSAEIRHLVYNLDRDYADALNKMTIKFGTGDVVKRAVEWGYLPMAKISQEFRMATFVDEFNKQKAAGRTDQEASLLADSRVRQEHGAASIVDLPAILSSSETMKMLTVFQGYFNTMYNWQRQIPGNLRRGEHGKAMTNALGSVVVGAAFGALLFNKRSEDDSWFKIMAKAMLIQPLSTIPILSHATSFFAEGFAPRMPIASVLTAAGSILTDAKHLAKGERVEKPITHTANVVGLTTGLPLAQVGRTGQFAADVATGKQRPKNIVEYARGIITGEAKLKK